MHIGTKYLKPSEEEVLKLISGLPKTSFSVFMPVQVMEAWDSTTSTSSKTILFCFFFY